MSTQRIVAEFKAAKGMAPTDNFYDVHQLVEFLTVKGLKIGGRYKHFKGAEYIVDAIGSDDVVEYHNATTGQEYERHLSMFLDMVTGHESGYEGPRFTLIG